MRIGAGSRAYGFPHHNVCMRHFLSLLKLHMFIPYFLSIRSYYKIISLEIKLILDVYMFVINEHRLLFTKPSYMYLSSLHSYKLCAHTNRTTYHFQCSNDYIFSTFCLSEYINNP